MGLFDVFSGDKKSVSYRGYKINLSKIKDGAYAGRWNGVIVLPDGSKQEAITAYESPQHGTIELKKVIDAHITNKDSRPMGSREIGDP